VTEQFTISHATRGPKIKIKKSIFIATIFPISNEKQFKTRLEEIKKDFSKASHNAWAYRFLENDKVFSDFHDDGEVKGTAGRILMQHLEKNSLVNTLLVVTRFYGGINLGKGGLIRSYSRTAMDLLENIKLISL
jgi:Xaa-Pro dipeptidase